MSVISDLRDWWKPPGSSAASPVRQPSDEDARVQAYSVIDLRDQYLPDFLSGGANSSGMTVNARTALRNSAVWRSVNIISNSIGMLPLHLWQKRVGGDRVKANGHPLFNILFLRPNRWQSAYTFRRLMQHWALTEGNGYALIVRSRDKIIGLHPIPPRQVTVEQGEDWAISYKVRNKAGGQRTVPASDIFHLMGPSENGFRGLALAEFAADVLGLSIAADCAAGRMFKNGVMAGGALSSDQKLNDDTIARLRANMEERYGGVDNSHRWMILEQGLKAETFKATARDAQNVETRKHQVEEVARIFGVPRPFLMMDDTSWGSGIEQLGMFFVQYGLGPWFKAWEEAISLTLLTDRDRAEGYYPKFNERALLRGLMKDQGEFLFKMAGAAGGSKPIMEQNEARSLLDLPEHPDGWGLDNGQPGTGDDDG